MFETPVTFLAELCCNIFKFKVLNFYFLNFTLRKTVGAYISEYVSEMNYFELNIIL